MTTRAAIYARVSTEEQAGEGKTSVDEQVRRCQRYVEDHDLQMVGVFRDKGVSGRRALGNRPDGGRLLSLLRAGGADVLIVTKLDRLNRSLRNAVPLMRELRDRGVAFVTVNEHFDTSSAMGRAGMDMALVFAELEVEQTRERSAAGQRAVAARGRWVSTPPFGWHLEDADGVVRGRRGRNSVLVPDEREREVLRVAVAAVVDERRSKGETAALLNGLGLYPRNSPAWTYEGLTRQLRSRALFGDAVWGGVDGRAPQREDQSEHSRRNKHHTLVDGRGKPLWGDPIAFRLPDPPLTEQRWQALQRLDANGYGAKRPDSVFPLSLRMTSLCGQPYYGLAAERRTRRYLCKGRKHRGTDLPKCCCDRLPADAVEPGCGPK
jgi:DNA invertase Pin-like site-specific DNA recombinase